MCRWTTLSWACRRERLSDPQPCSHLLCLHLLSVICGSYSTDYMMEPGGTGNAAGLVLPENATDVERIWDFYSQLTWARYKLADANG